MHRSLQRIFLWFLHTLKKNLCSKNRVILFEPVHCFEYIAALLKHIDCILKKKKKKKSKWHCYAWIKVFSFAGRWISLNANYFEVISILKYTEFEYHHYSEWHPRYISRIFNSPNFSCCELMMMNKCIHNFRWEIILRKRI